MKKVTFLLLAALVAILCAGCMKSGSQPEQPEGQDKASGGAYGMPRLPEFEDRDENGVPLITVYDAAADEYEEMDVESYVMGVLAGEMRSDWPMEALKAQAILARTFTLKFIAEKESMYPNADISTDVAEAQAYDAEAVNERIRRAVNETRGRIMAWHGELPYAWFHAHSGGMTELASAALHFDSDPGYIEAVESHESDLAPTAVKQWTAVFPAEEVAEAARECGAEIHSIVSIEPGEKGASGRVVSFLINGQAVNAADLRVHLDPGKLKSTLLSSVTMKDGKVTFAGSGYGHGVGMSQWGAYQMASEGSTAPEIIHHYFKDVELVNAWAS